MTFASSSPAAPAPPAEPPRSTEPSIRRRTLALVGFGVLAVVAGGALVLTSGADPDAGGLVGPVAVATPVPRPSSAPSAERAPEPVSTGRNVFAPLVSAPAAAVGVGAAATSTPSSATASPVATGSARQATDSGRTAPATVPPSAVAQAQQLSVQWNGPAGGDTGADSFVVVTGAGSTTVEVPPGSALGTAAPLSWMTADGAVDGKLTLRIGTATYELTRGRSVVLF